jgi:hypothetical protein
MATDIRNKQMTAHYNGGAVIGATGFINYLFETKGTRWAAKPDSDGKGKRKYGTTQRASARAGRIHYVLLADGSTYSVRVVGPTKRFIDAVIRYGDTNKITRIYTQSGTKYGETVENLAGA